MALFEDVKLALRKTTDSFDAEIQALIDDCLAELKMLGIYKSELEGDPQILTAVVFYCKSRFGENPESEKWEKLYRDKVEKLMIAAGYSGGCANG